MAYSNNMTGVLFRAKNRKNEKAPEYSGSCEINGVKYGIGAWVRQTKKTAEKFFSMKFEPEKVEPEDVSQDPEDACDRFGGF
jgi:uncharacterized protein (DUF736 family)